MEARSFTILSWNKRWQSSIFCTLYAIECFSFQSIKGRMWNLIPLRWTRQIWGIWKLRPAYSSETPNLGQNRWCFVPCDLEIWWMTLENNRASLLSVNALRITVLPDLTIFSCDQAALQMVFSVRLSICPSHLFDYVPIIVSSWNFQELLPMTDVRSMQKVKVRGQMSRSQRSWPNLTVSGL